MIHHGACPLISGFIETPFLQKSAIPGDTHVTAVFFSPKDITSMLYHKFVSTAAMIYTIVKVDG